ncbi:MAG: EAL domain-containing protein [Gammaproteobacteria bacterium]|nr:EAL domain-containing protein [Gammaproteobacteria bacterium]
MFLFREKSKSEDSTNGNSAFAALPYKKRLKQLETAINKSQFTIYLQPIINLSSWSIQGVEVLLRWRHPEYGLLTPDYFLSDLEKSGLINKVDPWVLKKAGHLNMYLTKCGLKPLRLAVNISCVHLVEKSFLPQLDSLITKSGISPEFLELEITDQCLFDNIDTQVNVLQKIRDKGIKLALKYSISGLPITIDLDRLPVDIINIDKELTHQITGNKENRQIMSTILTFSKTHQLEVVAEGIETAEQLIFLNAMHCNAGQGFLLSHPSTIKDFTELYQSGKKFDYIIDKVSNKL